MFVFKVTILLVGVYLKLHYSGVFVIVIWFIISSSTSFNVKLLLLSTDIILK